MLHSKTLHAIRILVISGLTVLAAQSILLAAETPRDLPEILDGNAPHHPRGCDAQAWSVSETLRVWTLLTGLRSQHRQ